MPNKEHAPTSDCFASAGASHLIRELFKPRHDPNLGMALKQFDVLLDLSGDLVVDGVLGVVSPHVPIGRQPAVPARGLALHLVIMCVCCIIYRAPRLVSLLRRSSDRVALRARGPRSAHVVDLGDYALDSNSSVDFEKL